MHGRVYILEAGKVVQFRAVLQFKGVLTEVPMAGSATCRWVVELCSSLKHLCVHSALLKCIEKAKQITWFGAGGLHM